VVSVLVGDVVDVGVDVVVDVGVDVVDDALDAVLGMVLTVVSEVRLGSWAPSAGEHAATVTATTATSARVPGRMTGS
jgi:hypothetical protein